MHQDWGVNRDASDLLLAATGERSIRAVALRAGFDPSTLTRQVKSGIKAETVIDVARAYGLPPVMTLVRFGFLTEAEAHEAASDSALAGASDERLAQEILDRVRSQNASAALTEPLSGQGPVDENVGGKPEDEIPHIGAVDVEALRRSGVALAADERDGIEEEQEQSQELP
ncbi:hypothetical protein [Leucobacter ruminantium]|uniref:Immunity repressor n=1 Tax=Leucobacter ruminantium TaxID=1289170 RepID=A0A939RUK7_9MICO|nr:hypothetical protein [Leucobacter ruminantium]MBO1805880.1 hypothetical protein [Leucobacter ruminantium]